MADLKEVIDEIERIGKERGLSKQDREAATVLARREMESGEYNEIESERLAKYAVNSLEQKSYL